MAYEFDLEEGDHVPFSDALSTEIVEALVRNTQPVSVTMETYYAKLSPEALNKYGRISETIQTCNYVSVDQFRDETTLKNYWLFERNA